MQNQSNNIADKYQELHRARMNKSRHDGAQFIYVRGSLRGLNAYFQLDYEHEVQTLNMG